jgi:HK97 family phage major capsid protein
MGQNVKTQPKRELKLAAHLTRTCKIEVRDRAAADGSAKVRSYHLPVSSEEPVLSSDWYGNSYWEVLGHDAGEVDLTRFQNGAAIRDQHYGPQIGVIDDVALGDRKMSVDLRFAQSIARGAEIQGAVDENVVQNVSIGYDVEQWWYMGDDAAGIPIYRAIRWTPYHVAIVPDPADITVGFGRATNEAREARVYTVTTKGRKPAEGSRMSKPVLRKRASETEGEELADDIEDEDEDAGRSVKPTSGRAAAGSGVSVLEERKSAVSQERERRDTITDLARAAGIEDEVFEAWIRDGVSVRDAATKMREATKTRGKAQPSAEQVEGGLGLKEKDAKRYSFARALRISAGMHRSGGGDFTREKFDGIEKEVHDECDRRLGSRAERHEGGVLVPWRLRDLGEDLATRAGVLRGRAQGATVTGGGAELVPEDVGELIDLLRPASAVYGAGAKIITGLSAPVAYPKKTQGLTGYWSSENPPTPVPFSEMQWAIQMLSPRTMMCATFLPRQLLIQASIDMEQEAKQDMVNTIGEMLDKGSLFGSGTGGSVLGIFNTPGVQVSDALGGIATFKDYLAMIAKAATATKQNNLGPRSWLTTVEYAGALAGTPKESGFPVYLWPTDPGTIDESTLVGFKARSSVQMATDLGAGGDEHGLLFGPFSQAVFGLFGAVEVIVDPYTLARSGQIAITYFQLADFMLRYPEAFVIGDGAKPA